MLFLWMTKLWHSCMTSVNAWKLISDMFTRVDTPSVQRSGLNEAVPPNEPVLTQLQRFNVTEGGGRGRRAGGIERKIPWRPPLHSDITGSEKDAQEGDGRHPHLLDFIRSWSQEKDAAAPLWGRGWCAPAERLSLWHPGDRNNSRRKQLCRDPPPHGRHFVLASFLWLRAHAGPESSRLTLSCLPPEWLETRASCFIRDPE